MHGEINLHGLQVQGAGTAGGLASLVSAQQSNSNNQRLGGGKYGGALNMNIGLTATKYQGQVQGGQNGPGAGGGAGAGLSVGPAAKSGSVTGDDKGGGGGKYTSPYSQKYVANARLSELDP